MLRCGVVRLDSTYCKVEAVGCKVAKGLGIVLEGFWFSQRPSG